MYFSKSEGGFEEAGFGVVSGSVEGLGEGFAVAEGFTVEEGLAVGAEEGEAVRVGEGDTGWEDVRMMTFSSPSVGFVVGTAMLSVLSGFMVAVEGTADGARLPNAAISSGVEEVCVTLPQPARISAARTARSNADIVNFFMG